MALIPNKIHFIWVGRSIPTKYLNQMLKLAALAKKSDFEFNIWIDDEKNYRRSLEKLRQETNEIPQELDVADRKLDEHIDQHLGVRVRKIDELLEAMRDDPFYLTDNRLRDFEYSVGREMIGLKNLAAASDFLRYEILRQEGGYYFDADTNFVIGSNSLLVADNAPQGILGNFDVNEKGKLGRFVGNDIIGVIPHHPLMERVIINSLDAYKKLDKQNELERVPKELIGDSGINEVLAKYREIWQLKIHVNTTGMDAKRYPYGSHFCGRAFLGSARRNETISSTGPGAIRKAIEEELLDPRKNAEVSLSIPLQIEAKYELFNRIIANIKVTSSSDQNWLEKEKLKSVKGLSLDDSTISSTIFGGSFQAKKGKSPEVEVENLEEQDKGKRPKSEK